MKMPKPPSISEKYGPKKINPGTGRLVTNRGKGGIQKMLPSRAALNALTKGNPSERSTANYAKLTPSGAGAPMTYQSIMDMATNGVNVRPSEDKF